MAFWSDFDKIEHEIKSVWNWYLKDSWGFYSEIIFLKPVQPPRKSTFNYNFGYRNTCELYFSFGWSEHLPGQFLFLISTLNGKEVGILKYVFLLL